MTTTPNFRAALDEQPVKPTDEELMDLAEEAWVPFSKSKPLPEGHSWDLVLARAVLARWGTPSIQPVPVSERLPGPEDCDAEGLCWWWSRDITAWCLCFAADGDSSEWTHWLPHWALPVPTPVNTNQEDT
jgi:hypothetical protein